MKIFKFTALVLAVFLIFSSPYAAQASVFLTCELKKEYIYSGLEGISDAEYAALNVETESIITKFESLIGVEVVGSDIYRINAAAGGEAVAVDRMTIELLELALQLYMDTEGAFNPAVYNLVKLWGFSPADEGNYSKSRKEPSANEIETFKDYLNFENIVLDKQNNTVIKPSSEMRLDLGAIAKGYLCDILKDELQGRYTDALISLVSSAYAMGYRKSVEEERPFKIAVTDPREGEYQCFYVNVSDLAVSTSGDYERFYWYKGKRYCHIINPSTGKPADNGIISITVVCNSGAVSDALSTAGFNLNPRAAAAMYERLEVSALIITADYNYYTIGDADFKVTSEEVPGYYKSRYTNKNIEDMSETVIPDSREKQPSDGFWRMAAIILVVTVTAATVVLIIIKKREKKW